LTLEVTLAPISELKLEKMEPKKEEKVERK
jgi:hypothetical protein